MGAVNALIANTDAPLFKDNNYYWYDWRGRALPAVGSRHHHDARTYVFTGGVGGQVAYYTHAMFSNWEADYRGVLQELLSQRLTQTVVGEMDRVAAGRAPPWTPIPTPAAPPPARSAT